MYNEIISCLQKYTGKKHVYLTQRGNKSILTALKIAKNHGAKKVVIQDQGGWITYLQYPEKLKMQLVKIKTNDGIIVPEELMMNINSGSAFLVNSLSGYFAEQPMDLVNAVCKQKCALLINDASGSIGTDTAKPGDIVIGSFGEGKPINMEYGGFIAFDDDSFYEKGLFEDLIFDKSKLPELLTKLKKLPERMDHFKKINNDIKNDLKDLNILHREKRGINVIVAYDNAFQKERIINYCHEHHYEFTECPRYIRVNRNAISIEVKRLR
jgi:hypothetical protein